MNLRAVTVCQPYAWLIEVGIKTVENRRTPFLRSVLGQDLAIHAGLSKDWFTDDAWGLVRHACSVLGLPAMRPGDFPFGVITSVVRVAAVVSPAVARRHFRDNPDALMHIHGEHCAVLDQLRRLARPVPARGQQGLWLLSREEEERVGREVRAGRAAAAEAAGGGAEGGLYG